MSVYLQDEIELAGYVVGDLLKHWEGYWIFSIPVLQLRQSFGQEISRDPRPDFPGHALVRDLTGRRGPGKRSRIAEQCVLELAGAGPASDTRPLMEAQIVDKNTQDDTPIAGRLWNWLRPPRRRSLLAVHSCNLWH